jgi:hypothetical protein
VNAEELTAEAPMAPADEVALRILAERRNTTFVSVQTALLRAAVATIASLRTQLAEAQKNADAFEMEWDKALIARAQAEARETALRDALELAKDWGCFGPGMTIGGFTSKHGNVSKEQMAQIVARALAGDASELLDGIDSLRTQLAEAEARETALREALVKAKDALNWRDNKVRLRHRDPLGESEIRALGERVGYGVLMSTASRLWHEKAGGGAFAVGDCLSTVEAADDLAARALAGEGR